MGFNDEKDEEIELEDLDTLINSTLGNFSTPESAMPGGYWYNGPQQPSKPALTEILRESRKSLGQCVKCGELLPISIHGLLPCTRCTI